MPLPVHPTVPALARAVRALHTTRARAQQLVGVPDPVSHLRPLLYTDAPGAPRPTDARAARIHPYSLREFRDPDAHADPARARADELGEYELRMHTARVDALDHAFWAEVRRPRAGVRAPRSPAPRRRTSASRPRRRSCSTRCRPPRAR
jgi:hypothetical protein